MPEVLRMFLSFFFLNKVDLHWKQDEIFAVFKKNKTMDSITVKIYINFDKRAVFGVHPCNKP